MAGDRGLMAFVRWRARAKVHHLPARARDPLAALRRRGVHARHVGPKPWTRYVWDDGAAEFDAATATLHVYCDELPPLSKEPGRRVPRESVALPRADWALVLESIGYELGEESVTEAVRTLLERARGRQ